MNTSKYIATLIIFTLIQSVGANPKATQPQDKPGYDKTKDAGAEAPKVPTSYLMEHRNQSTQIGKCGQRKT